MAITIANLISRFKQLADTDPRCNSFGAGPLYDIIDDIKYYPYVWIVNDVSHNIRFTEINKYRALEYNFILRVGDKVNNQENVYMAYGENSNNGLDISSDTFTILVDMVNAISEDSLGLFSDVTLIDDISVEPFFHEDTGDVNGHMAQIVLRAKITDPCLSPITDDLVPPVGPTQSPTQSCSNFTQIDGTSTFYSGYPGGPFTLLPVDINSWSDGWTQFVYDGVAISWNDALSTYGFMINDMRGNPEMDLIYGVVPQGDVITGNTILIGTINGVWHVYELHDGGSGKDVYDEAFTNDACGLGNYDCSSSTWGLETFTIS